MQSLIETGIVLDMFGELVIGCVILALGTNPHPLAMYLFLVPLLLGFASNLASAFTVTFFRWWDERNGTLAVFLLRNVFGIPVWGVGFVHAARTSSPKLFASTAITAALGWIIITAGAVIIVVALAAIRLKAAMPSSRDALASKGLYGCVRHPIHSGTILEFVGLLLVVPKLTIALACAIGIVWIILQTKFEEIDLLQRLPGYREYMNAVPTFFPRFWSR